MIKTYELEICSDKKWRNYCTFTDHGSANTLIKEIIANKQMLKCQEYRMAEVISNRSILIQIKI